MCVRWFTLTSWRIQAASSEVLILQLKCLSGPSVFITEDEVWLSPNHCCQPSNIHSGRMQMASVWANQCYMRKQESKWLWCRIVTFEKCVQLINWTFGCYYRKEVADVKILLTVCMKRLHSQICSIYGWRKKYTTIITVWQMLFFHLHLLLRETNEIPVQHAWTLIWLCLVQHCYWHTTINFSMLYPIFTFCI